MKRPRPIIVARHPRGLAGFSMPDPSAAPPTTRRCVHRNSRGEQCMTRLHHGHDSLVCYAHEEKESNVIDIAELMTEPPNICA